MPALRALRDRRRKRRPGSAREPRTDGCDYDGTARPASTMDDSECGSWRWSCLRTGTLHACPRLDELGWLQFERLCELVLEADAGVDPARWEGSADATAARRVRRRAAHRRAATLAPPVLIRCLWLRDATARIAALGDPQARAVGVALGRHVRQPPARARAAAGEHVVYGEAELLEAIRRLPGAAAAAAVRALARRAAPPDAGGARALDVRRRGRARARARLRADAGLERALSRRCKAHNFLVLTGPPEMGKTAIARMLGLALLTEGWEVHECTRPEQV